MGLKLMAVVSAYQGSIAAAGAILAPPPSLVSLWGFDETGGASFADSGPANVPMTVVGTWADLSTASLAQGVSGTSAYTDGSAHATIPANDPDHDLAALTISFYYQRNSAAAKHVLLAVGDGTVPGDLSIEVLPDGKLRGYHVGQDGVLRFFDSSSGIAGTDLQVGTAHRIDLTLGFLGARIYLDGAPLTSGAIPANTNGWNNTRTKYLGVFSDGTSAPADGAFDRFRIWDQQLSGGQIATLEPAQSVTLPGVPPTQELSVPSLAEWLTSDEVDPTPTKFVANQNRGNGSGSSPANAQELQAALNVASAGQTFLAVCQTPGTIEFWDYPSGLSFPSGTSGNLITLQARQGDGVVISAGEDFAGARTPGSGFWTQSGLSQADIDNKIWRSVSSFPGGEQDMMGFWIEFAHPHQIVRASSMSDLRAAYSSADSPTGYAGPSVHKDTDGRVYIRFQQPHPDKYSRDGKWSANTWPGYPEAVSNGRLVYPISEDPNDYTIHLFRVSSNVIGFNPGNAGEYVEIGSGINSMGYRNALNGNRIRCGRGTHLTWHSFVATATTAAPKDDYFCHRTRCSDGSKLHLGRAEWKFGGWLEGIRDSWFIMFNEDTASNIYCLDCTIGDYHEILVGSAHANRFRWRNCTFVNILDDGVQLPNNFSRAEIGYCYFYNSAWGGFGRSGSDGGDDQNPGNFFLHHNIFDYRQERVTNWRSQPHPGFIFGQHSPDGNNPRKIYNNLFMFGPDTEEENSLGFAHADQNGDGGNNTLTGPSNMHEVFNNIVLRVFLEGTKRYDAVVTSPSAQYSDNFQNRCDYVMGRMQRYGADYSNELSDYNLYWRPSQMTSDAALRGWRRGAGQTIRNFNTLGDWQASSEFQLSKNGGSMRGAYPPGFDGNSTEVKPNIPSLDNYPVDRFNYRPAAYGQVTTATSSSLGGADWWSTPPAWGAAYFPWNDGEKTLAPTPWKGALDPNGATLPVGVQNP